jgi:hypothetical protein
MTWLALHHRAIPPQPRSGAEEINTIKAPEEYRGKKQIASSNRGHHRIDGVCGMRVGADFIANTA